MTRGLSWVGLVLVLASPAAAQETTNQQLLQEVRKLREAIETMVSTTARVQIVFGRLQLQEQRTATAMTRADAARARATSLSREQATMETNQQDIETRLATGNLPPEQQRSFEAELVGMRRLVASLEAKRQQAVSDEAQAMSELNAEQLRWSGLNEQLEQLERALSKKP